MPKLFMEKKYIKDQSSLWSCGYEVKCVTSRICQVYLGYQPLLFAGFPFLFARSYISKDTLGIFLKRQVTLPQFVREIRPVYQVVHWSGSIEGLTPSSAFLREPYSLSTARYMQWITGRGKSRMMDN